MRSECIKAAPACSMEVEDQDEEDLVVLVDLSGLPNPDTVRKYKGPCSLLGIDGEEPILQLGSNVFRGKYEDILGTCMVFSKDKEKKQLQYLCKTNKRLLMSRVVLKEKSATTGGTPSTTTNSKPEEHETEHMEVETQQK